ncbi:Uncharacterised protein [Mycobacteroides abscessus subsp. massiliense]|uniref:Uncharacterized protein n=1 Tax=Mycobacteroides abscessus subsp. massiliense TaxID=1962118 RepID=A0A1U0FGG0_9MYCO|nr:Uncharacterised protein [Mycobacteroides abscessus subsp. abscessus]SKE63801.1 Uncharacterised protein [Mycobacteroides abscessus subsp. massiliense]SKH64110.1 Uncharacterised protein [Mycobacteroides abscessus subsp. massiliense]SKI36137.1 Uncharacterised protein [Mycobacteroides abscessus subsp. massiliense]SKJ29501.1 Uncharacterised protein [Mycobacteroides abscessus subsp. massiliense]
MCPVCSGSQGRQAISRPHCAWRCGAGRDYRSPSASPAPSSWPKSPAARASRTGCWWWSRTRSCRFCARCRCRRCGESDRSPPRNCGCMASAPSRTWPIWASPPWRRWSDAPWGINCIVWQTISIHDGWTVDGVGARSVRSARLAAGHERTARSTPSQRNSWSGLPAACAAPAAAAAPWCYDCVSATTPAPPARAPCRDPPRPPNASCRWPASLSKTLARSSKNGASPSSDSPYPTSTLVVQHSWSCPSRMRRKTPWHSTAPLMGCATGSEPGRSPAPTCCTEAVGRNGHPDLRRPLTRPGRPGP